MIPTLMFLLFSGALLVGAYLARRDVRRRIKELKRRRGVL